MAQQPIRKLRSVRTLFLLAMAIVILILSVPLILSGSTLLNGIIHQLGTELLSEKLTAQINPIELRYKTLRRVGLEDSAGHLAEIKQNGLETLGDFRYMASGRMFVIGHDGAILLSSQFTNDKDPDFSLFLNQLRQEQQGILEYAIDGEQQLASFAYYAPWDSYLGLTISKTELFAPRILFFKFNILILIVVLGIALLFTFGLQRLIIDPLIRLTNFATRIRQGDYQAEVQPGTFILEPATLKKDIIAMVASLRGSMEETALQLTVIRQREEELAKALDELRESEERYRQIFNAPSDAIFIHDATTGDILDVNKGMQEMFGYSKAEAQALTVESFSANTPPYTQIEAEEKIGAAVQKGPQLFEWRSKKKDGTLFWTEVSLRYTEFHDQGYVIAVARDIDARKIAEEALATEKEQLAVTLRSIGDGVITTDTGGRVVLLNAVAEKLTGWSQQDAAGRPLPEVFHIVSEKTGKPCANPADKVMDTGQTIELANHTALLNRNGSKISIADSGAPIHDPSGHIIGVVLVFRDVTEKLRTEQELLKIKKLESVGVLAAGIAHDFNNILAAILGNIDLATTQVEPGNKACALLEEAGKATLRAKDLTQQLLTFARGGTPVRQAASIDSIIRESAEFTLRGSNITCEYEIPEDLWLVDIDQGQMSQVIQNIILNARQAMPGSGTISITCSNNKEISKVAGREQGNYVSIAICDTGIGIPDEILDTIFDPYFTSKENGSGLGLAVCYSIISKHDGRIEVSSTLGKGTTFTILLPASKETAIEKPAKRKPAGQQKNARILIMDDEELVRSIAEKMLIHQGHTVTTCNDGESAIALYGQALTDGNKFDLVIMDLTIPGGMGGKEAVTAILDLDPDARVVVASGYSNDPIMADFRAYGFRGMLSKPFLLDDLNRTVQDILEEE